MFPALGVHSCQTVRAALLEGLQPVREMTTLQIVSIVVRADINQWLDKQAVLPASLAIRLRMAMVVTRY